MYFYINNIFGSSLLKKNELVLHQKKSSTKCLKIILLDTIDGKKKFFIAFSSKQV